jgi:hypothetical protein
VRLATRVTRVADGALVLDGEAEVAAPREKRVFEDVDMPGLVVQRHRHFEALLDLARPLPPLVTAVVAPEEPNSLGGAVKAAAESIITPILIGDPVKIAAAAREIGADIWQPFEVSGPARPCDRRADGLRACATRAARAR